MNYPYRESKNYPRRNGYSVTIITENSFSQPYTYERLYVIMSHYGKLGVKFKRDIDGKWYGDMDDALVVISPVEFFITEEEG